MLRPEKSGKLAPNSPQLGGRFTPTDNAYSSIARFELWRFSGSSSSPLPAPLLDIFLLGTSLRFCRRRFTFPQCVLSLYEICRVVRESSYPSAPHTVLPR